eukprot:2995652-Rhodomonas_salina.1
MGSPPWRSSPSKATTASPSSPAPPTSPPSVSECPRSQCLGVPRALRSRPRGVHVQIERCTCRSSAARADRALLRAFPLNRLLTPHSPAASRQPSLSTLAPHNNTPSHPSLLSSSHLFLPPALPLTLPQPPSSLALNSPEEHTDVGPAAIILRRAVERNGKGVRRLIAVHRQVPLALRSVLDHKRVEYPHPLATAPDVCSAEGGVQKRTETLLQEGPEPARGGGGGDGGREVEERGWRREGGEREE